MSGPGVYIDSSDEDYEACSDFESGSDEESELEVGELENPPTWTTKNTRRPPFSFSKISGVNVPPQSLFEYFTTLFDDKLVESIVHHTNCYGSQFVKRNKKSSMTPATNVWKTLTVPEFKTFVGLLLHMGNIRMSQISSYWHSGKLFGLKCFSDHMNPGRFLVILRCLQFSGTKGPLDDPLRKVRNLVNYFNTKMETVYYPAKNLWLGEGKTIWRAHVAFPADEPGGEAKMTRGVKLYTLTEPEGMVLRCELRPVGLRGGEVAKADIVLCLMQGMLNSGHTVYLDKSYTSFTLARSLLDLNTFCTGFLNLDRRHTPLDVKDAKLKAGETVARFADGVMIGRWKGDSDVSYISTEFDNTMTTVLTRTGLQSKPIAVARCKVTKVCRREGPLGAFEEEMPCFRFEKRAFTWTKRLFVHILNLFLANAFLMLRRHDKSWNSMQGHRFYKEFRLSVVQSLLPQSAEEMPTPTIKPVILMRCPEHTPSKADRGVVSTKRKRCRVCGSSGVRKDTTFVCKACPGEPGLCIINCFDEYHRRFNTKGTQVMMDASPFLKMDGNDTSN